MALDGRKIPAFPDMSAGEVLFGSNWIADLDLPLDLPDPRSGLHLVSTGKSLSGISWF